MYRLLERPGFERGRHIPTPHKYLDLNDLSEEELNDIAKKGGNWIQEGMKLDAQ